MSQATHDVRFDHHVNEERQQTMLGFIHELDDHIRAIQEAGRERLMSGADGADSPAAISIDISTGPDPELLAAAEVTKSTVTVSVPCGKSESGYIYCTITYCEIIGPITVEA